MKKRTEKQFEAWCNKKLIEIQKVLLLDSFTLNPIEKMPEADMKNGAYAHSQFSYPYKDITVRYTPPMFKDWKDGNEKEVIGTLIHEMVHPITDPLYGVGFDRFSTKEQLNNEREACTDHFANIIIKLSTLAQ